MLWLLTSKKDKPSYDVTNGVVVRARSPHTARQLAAACRGDEGEDTWTNPQYSTCTRLKEEGGDEVILIDFSAG